MIYPIAKKHSEATARIVHKCKRFDKDFHSFFNFPEHKQKEHGAQRGSVAQSSNVGQLMGDNDGNGMKEELETCKHFLVDSEMENGRHRVWNCAMDYLDPKYLLEKLDVVFDSLKFAAKRKVTFCFVLKNLDYGSCRSHYAQEHNTLLERSQIVATAEDLKKVKNQLSNIDVFESCTRERSNTKWIIYKLSNVTVFAALLKEGPIGCRDTVLRDPLLKYHPFKCLTFEENTRKPYNDNLCLFGALAFHMQGHDRLEGKTSKLFHLFLKNLVVLILQSFEVFRWKILQQWRILIRQIIPCTILTL